MKKITILMMLAVAFGAVLAGCSQSAEEKPAEGAATSAGDAGAAAPAEGN